MNEFFYIFIVLAIYHGWRVASWATSASGGVLYRENGRVHWIRRWTRSARLYVVFYCSLWSQWFLRWGQNL